MGQWLSGRDLGATGQMTSRQSFSPDPRGRDLRVTKYKVKRSDDRSLNDVKIDFNDHDLDCENDFNEKIRNITGVIRWFSDDVDIVPLPYQYQDFIDRVAHLLLRDDKMKDCIQPTSQKSLWHWANLKEKKLETFIPRRYPLKLFDSKTTASQDLRYGADDLGRLGITETTPFIEHNIFGTVGNHIPDALVSERIMTADVTKYFPDYDEMIPALKMFLKSYIGNTMDMTPSANATATARLLRTVKSQLQKNINAIKSCRFQPLTDTLLLEFLRTETGEMNTFHAKMGFLIWILSLMDTGIPSNDTTSDDVTRWNNFKDHILKNVSSTALSEPHKRLLRILK